MGKETGISWCDHTFNPWWGCTKVSPGCKNCYAEAFERRTGGDHFGPGKERRYFGPKHWNEPLKWDRDAARDGVHRKVFCGSMCDWADEEGSRAERARLMEIIGITPNLTWLLLTKRPNLIPHAAPAYWSCMPMDNVWLGTTVETAEQKPRINSLREMPATKRFLSCEPLLGPLGELDLTGIDWVIVGGESGPNARPMDPEWAVDIQRQCKEQNVAFFFKQHGGRGRDKGGCLLNGVEVKEFPPENP